MTDLNTEKRGPGRPPLRTENARPSLRDRLRGKVRKHTTNEDRFFIPEEYKVEGVSYEWKRFSVHGEENSYYLSDMRRQGFEPVTAEDMPDYAPEGHDGAIIKDGLILMARPQELRDQAEAELKKLSRQQISDRERANGTSDNENAVRHAPHLEKQVMRPVPVEE